MLQIEVLREVANGPEITKFICALTPAESHKWHNYITGLSIYIDFIDKAAKFDWCKHQGGIDECLKTARELADINERLYIIGKEWYEREVLDGKGDSDSKDQIPTGESKE